MMNQNGNPLPPSEQQLQRVCKALFETAAEGLVVTDVNGTIVLLNQRAEEMLGYAPGELIGHKVERLVPIHAMARHVEKRDVYVQLPTRRSMGMGLDLSARRQDGTEFPVEISINHFDIDGQRFVMALISDITKRKETERALAELNSELELRVQARTRDLAESKLLYEIIARNFPNGAIMVIDKDLRYVFAEGRELFRLGVTSLELVGTNYLDRLTPDVQASILPKLEAVFEGQAVHFDMIVDEKHYEMHAVPLRDHEGIINRILVVETNVTSQRKAERKLLDALEKERQLNALKSRFVSMASHEFRTPLSTILTSLSLMGRYTAPEQEADRVKHQNRIKSSVHQLTGILNDFLSLDKLESGMIATNPEAMDLREQLLDWIDELQPICKQGQEISIKYAGETMVFLDRHMVRNILVNLVSNAIKYSGENKPIEVDAHVQDGKVLLKVKDYGIGIPDGDKAHMFERFFRANNATNIQGTGLGLNIVKRYLDLMGGDIWFDSTHGVGSVFSVVLPQNQVQ